MSYADRAEFAAYVCQECGAVITDRDKPEMLKHGEWRIVEQRTQFPRKVREFDLFPNQLNILAAMGARDKVVLYNVRPLQGFPNVAGL